MITTMNETLIYNTSFRAVQISLEVLITS